MKRVKRVGRRNKTARLWIIEALGRAGRPLYSVEIVGRIKQQYPNRRNNISIRQVGSLCAAMPEVEKLKDEAHGCLWRLRYGQQIYMNTSDSVNHESEEE